MKDVSVKTVSDLDIAKLQAFMGFLDKLKSKRFWFAIIIDAVMLGLWVGKIIPCEFTLHILIGVFAICIVYLVSETIRPSLAK